MKNIMWKTLILCIYHYISLTDENITISKESSGTRYNDIVSF